MKKQTLLAHAGTTAVLLLALVGGLAGAQAPDQEAARIVVAASPAAVVATLGTGFTYQGQLIQDGDPVNGTCDLQFTLYDAASGGNEVGSLVERPKVDVTGGLFTVLLDFGSTAFIGEARWLQVAVRCPFGTGDYTVVDGLQELTATPYALYAAGNWALSGNAGTTPGTHYLGTSDAVALTLGVNGVAALRIEPNDTSPNLIGGYSGNTVSAGIYGATIAGGGQAGLTCGPGDPCWNQITGRFGTIGGGIGNTAGGWAATVGGGEDNTVSGGNATVGGGLYNFAIGSSATIGGGFHNDASGNEAAVGGGSRNTASNYYTTIGGGYSNTASGYHTTIGGGHYNIASASSATVSGGCNNSAAAQYGSIAGGGSIDSATGNRVTDDYGSVGGGYDNQAGDNAGTAADAPYATVAGGASSKASGPYAAIAGGWTNLASGEYAAVGGGASNVASGYAAAIGGGRNNSAEAKLGAIAGGGSENWSTRNRVTDDYGSVGGGFNNQAGDNAGTAADAPYATVAGGASNAAKGGYAAVGGGWSNTAGGSNATVPGGALNSATGQFSLAAGLRSKAVHPGSFVWGDSTEADISSTADNQFVVRAYGGVKLVRGSSTFMESWSALHVEQAQSYGEGIWARISDASNSRAVLKLIKPSSTSNFAEGAYNGGAQKFHIDNNGTFVGGSDFAESLPVAGDKAAYAPGDVLVLSSAQPGAVEKSSQPYDGLVVGVYSFRPAVLGADKDGVTVVGANEIPVAVVGIVPVRVSAENGAIRAGDLLTTSATSGHAMRCAGAQRCFGRTMGKALEGLSEGAGVIKVLVALQ